MTYDLSDHEKLHTAYVIFTQLDHCLLERDDLDDVERNLAEAAFSNLHDFYQYVGNRAPKENK